ncbi:LysM peptidoglycan-binding domain-containing protein [Tropicibacter oceani]|uniref:LysM domain-containing protein n=1 Tax=Tropicibacter oceani TaxID=3058420 RepID=A0ABY8QJL4_9RHOB|nr:LysM domain-containing protein [Tropicibacter oceani]WGW04193.1 LysM domain-containing protein [Tropicibacter oceani]
MMRLIVLSTGFLAITAGLLWVGLAPLDEPAVDFNEVSRSQPVLLSLTPAMAQPQQAPVAPAPAAVQVQVQPEPVRQAAPTPAPAALAAAPATGDVDAIDALRAISYGIMKELQPPAPKADAPQRVALADPVQPAAAVAQPKPAGQTYTVQQGDSLPGISFRFYGTTVAYMQIIEANPDQLASPADLRAGMTLKIPKTN